LQGYSNIEAWNIPFILSVAGFTWQMNDSHSLFAGIRRIDEDYFNSDGLALFVNSSCGGFPTIVGNFFTPAYPMASMGVHYVYDSERLGVQASLYNGIGSYEFTGRYNIFRVCPKSDGIFALAQAEYRHQNSHYFLGASVHDWDELLLRERKLRPSVWTYAEQALSKRLTLLAAYSHAFSNDEVCNNFYGIGGRYACKNLEFGLFSDYTRILEIDEWATELTCKLGLSNSLSLQPALHIIKTDNETQCIGMMRLNISL
jgi:porin